MSALQRYMPFFTSAMLMCVVLYVIYPHYQYYIDPDGTAYLTISARYARGDYQTAVNGYWSPWSCWLTALMIKGGMLAIPASVVINALGGVGFMYISQSFFLRFGIVRNMQWLLNVTLSLFLCYAIFWQSFDDLWECFFLLCTLRIILADDYMRKPALWLFCGIIGALAYFAKAYSFPFFILNTVCCGYFISKDDKVQWLKMSAVAVLTMVVCSMPWIVALHNKYGIWTTSTAGSLNMSWYLVGHPYWKEGIDLLLPPPYKDSPYYWEDPWFVNGATPHFWDSWRLFGMQVLRVGYNVLKFIMSILQLSLFFPVVVFFALKSLVSRGESPDQFRVIPLSFCLFPLAYFLVNFEARYLWYMLPLSMVAGSSFIQKRNSRLLPWVFALSFLVVPAFGMYSMYNSGKGEFDLAHKLKQSGVRGTFAAWSSRADFDMRRLAYFFGNPYYCSRDKDHAPDMKELKRYGIKYLICQGINTYQIEELKIYPEVATDTAKRIKVLLINPL